MLFNMPQKQKGMTAISWIVVLAVFFFFVLIGLRLTPIYLEYFNVSSSLSSLPGDKKIIDAGPSEIKGLLLKRFQINDVENVTRKHIKVTEKGVQVKYEVRTNIFANIDVVVSFDDFVKVSNR